MRRRMERTGEEPGIFRNRLLSSAIAQGCLNNLEERHGRPVRLAVANPLPDVVDILPAAAAVKVDLEVLHRCAMNEGEDGPPPTIPEEPHECEGS